LARLPDSTLLHERCKPEVIDGDLQAVGDVVADHLQPPNLLSRESPPAIFLLSDPVRESRGDLLFVRDQLVFLTERVANQRDALASRRRSTLTSSIICSSLVLTS